MLYIFDFWSNNILDSKNYTKCIWNGVTTVLKTKMLTCRCRSYLITWHSYQISWHWLKSCYGANTHACVYTQTDTHTHTTGHAWHNMTQMTSHTHRDGQTDSAAHETCTALQNYFSFRDQHKNVHYNISKEFTALKLSTHQDEQC
jgi:hypothetical protein